MYSFKVARGYLLQWRFPFLKLIFGMKASTDFCDFGIQNKDVQILEGF